MTAIRTLAARLATAAAVATVSAVALTPIAGATGSEPKSCPNNVLDNCYTKAEMADFLEIAVGFIEDYYNKLSSEGQYIPPPNAVVYIPTGKESPSGCADGNGNYVQNDEAFAYCPIDSTVYVGQEQLWLFYHELGAVSPVVGLAHEYGHHLQNVRGVPNPKTGRESIQHENQADCIAGAWAEYANEQGNLEYKKDLANIGDLLTSIGSMEGADRDHGTSRERKESFLIGFEGTLPACNDFYSSAPLVHKSSTA